LGTRREEIDVTSADVAAVLAGGLLALVAAFQAALAGGAPWGDMSYGGRAETVGGVLPPSYRAMSAASVLVLAFGAWIVLERAGLVGSGILGDGFLRAAVWALVVFLVANTATNAASKHPIERFGFGAVSLVAAAACFIVART
jgi:hypothetical protein